MCDEDAKGVGDLVPDDRVIYRACTRSSFLSGSKDAVEPIAFQKDGKNHKDGLSLALSAIDSVKRFSRNYGVISIAVSAIHGLNRGLEVHFDTTDASHVLIRNLPCMDRSSEEKELALAVSAELANAARVESDKRVPVPAPAG